MPNMTPKAAATLTTLAILLVIAIGVFLSAAYTLDETEQAVILQFGKPVGDPVVSAGLHFKMPFVQEVRRFDKRLLTWDGSPEQVPTRGREFISVDTTARWRIIDPLQFLRSVRDENGAQSRLDDIIDSVARDMISSSELTEIVRSSNWEVSEQDLEDIAAETVERNDVELTKEVKLGREKLTREILRVASLDMPEKYGIELVDVRIKRLNYIPEVREQVFSRMTSERQRIAEQFRSEGQGEASRIRGETSRELAEIRSEAQRQAEIIRGQADAQATRIYSAAYAADPEFYSFSRTLESYAKSLGAETTLMISVDSEYFDYLRDIDLPEASNSD